MIDFCFPNHTCIVCRAELNAPANRYFCANCAKDFVINTEPLLLRDPEAKQHFTRAHAAFIYGGEIANLIMRFKYNNEADIAEALAPFMAATAIHGGLITAKQKPDMIIPVPLSAKRFRKRGYNQAQALATELSAHLATAGFTIPVAENILIRTKTTEAQKHMTVAERSQNLRGAFALAPNATASGVPNATVSDVNVSGVATVAAAASFVKPLAKAHRSQALGNTSSTGNSLKGKRILLVDDVFTSGATANECAKTLRAAGAARTDVLTIAAAVN